MPNTQREKAMRKPRYYVPVSYYINPVTGDIYDLEDGGNIIVKNEDRHPDSPPCTNAAGETFDVWTGELISRPKEDEEDEQWFIEEAAKEAAQQSATKAADEDDAIEANTGGFTADDIKEALESRTPGMQALLRARPDES